MADPKPQEAAPDPAAERFVEDLLARGEAADESDEPLPADVTHEVVEDPDGGAPKVRRRRFSVD